ncbi:hypothetical protein L208DRAFT_1111572, partial [Tricholoma matsutake]
LKDQDIPHCTKLSKLISTRFQVEYRRMYMSISLSLVSYFTYACLNNSLGHISLTSDIWSRQNPELYMAVT